MPWNKVSPPGNQKSKYQGARAERENPTFVVEMRLKVGYTAPQGGPMMIFRRPKPPQRSLPMIHDLVLAVVFLAMIITPALLAMRSEKEERDTF